MNNKPMDLTNIIHLYSLVSLSEDNRQRTKALSQEEIKALNWNPHIVRRKPVNRMNTERFLERNLGDFFRYMIDYSEF
jgi:hypothetical protein|tara:strand:- start:30 stop:263 length:234 start_codon:yes stop_codon:yes gene_type:complete